MIKVSREEINIEELNQSAIHPACGAVLTFSGTVRNNNHSKQVLKLAYEAYEEMAQKEMEKLAEEACKKWKDVKKIQAVHRFGEMGVNESSIYITVSSGHRPEGFEALRFMIDRIKRDVPIWKKEFYERDSTWL